MSTKHDCILVIVIAYMIKLTLITLYDVRLTYIGIWCGTQVISQLNTKTELFIKSRELDRTFEKGAIFSLYMMMWLILL